MLLSDKEKNGFNATGCYRQTLQEELASHASTCSECRLCVRECLFLKKYGTPKQIAISYDPASPAGQTMPFECSLCRLCESVCPPQIGLNPARMFLEMRREAVERGAGDFSEHGVILGYERRGTSKRYSYYALPAGCDTVFFPGCALPGTRPGKVRQLFAHLQKNLPTLGIVLDCCTKPSHDLGRDKHFLAMFGEMRDFLLNHGIRNILVACPNCYRVFTEYGRGLTVITVYEYLESHGLPSTPKVRGTVAVHDPCAIRYDKPVHAAVRRLAEQKGLTLVEMKHKGTKTLCCGEGGSVGCLLPDLSQAWGNRRKEEANATRILTYCAGCANFLGARTPTSHLVDLLFEPEATLAGRAKSSRAPWTYLNRILLKNHFRKKIKAATSRERTFSGPETPGRAGVMRRLGFLAVLVGIIVAIRAAGVTQYLDQERLRQLIDGYGTLTPLLYMFAYAVAPALFLPGLPLTIAGGILFGPFWGVIYTITSSTIGACLAFLIARYIGRDWISQKLKSPRWKKLDEMVEEHGWKAVAFTRLIPAFPFNLLNYAFGLTRVRFSHYALATLIFMLPACVAFVVFSSSLIEVIRGKVTTSFYLGVLLIFSVLLTPFIYRSLKSANPKPPIKVEAEGSALAPAGAMGRPDSYDLKRSFQRKGLILSGLAALGLVIFLVVQRYFYFLDAYLYTYEFYWLFNVNNLRAGNVSLFADYFRPMGIATEALPQIILSHLIQNFYLAFSKPILVSAATTAFGLGLGLTFSYLALLATGAASFAIGTYFLGDILPFAQREKFPNYRRAITRPITIVLAISFVMPWIPVSLAATAASFFKIPGRRIFRLMLASFPFRIAGLLVAPSLFL